MFSLDKIASAIIHHLPNCSIRSIIDRGMWIRHSYRVELNDGRTVWLKIDADPHAGECCEKEAYICDLLGTHGLPAPKTLALDMTGEVLSRPFMIQEHLSGRPLDAWLRELPGGDAIPLFAELGAFFRKLHAIHSDRSGWIYGSGKVLDRHPNDFMHQAVMVENARRLVEQGLIDEKLHNRMVSLSEALLPELKNHKPSLVCSTLPWTICLDRADGRWTVTRLTDMHDALYWDPVNNLSGIKYPAFGQSNNAHWKAFMSGYGGLEPDGRHMKYYFLLTCIDGALGNYMEPRSDENDRWRQAAVERIGALVEELQK